MVKKPIITICSSAHFYKQAVAIEEQLRAMGYTVIIPSVAYKMKESGDYDVSHYKTWFADASDYGKKAALMRAHFEKVAQGDAVLVLNYEKHGVPNYIGGNVLMEMSLGFYLKKPVFVLHEIPEASPFEEEIKGLGSIPLHGRLEVLADHLPLA